MQLFCWDYNQSRPAFKDETEASARPNLAAEYDTAPTINAVMTPLPDESTEAAPESNVAPPEWIDRSAPLWIEAGERARPPVRRRHGLWLGTAGLALAVGYIFIQAQQKHATRPTIVGPIASSESLAAGEISRSTPANSTIAADAPRILVHVVGKVKRPGVYEFPPNARVRDAVARAGGATADADLNALNLAAWLEDARQIEVPSKTATVEATSRNRTRNSSQQEASVDNSSIANGSGAPRSAKRAKRLSTPHGNARRASTPPQSTLQGSARVAAQEALAGKPINLNRASSEELELLPGIGPAIAGRIVLYREENGDFATVDELDEVKGIGAKKLEKLRPFVIVR